VLRTLVQRRLLYAIAFAGITIAVLLGLSLSNQAATASSSQAASVILEPIGVAQPGAAIKVQIVATNVRDLAGFQAKVRFDSAKLRLLDASVATDLQASGRDLLALEPLVQPGAVTLGAATCPVRNCHDPRPQRAQRIDRGVDGRVVLGTIEFYATQPGEYALTLDRVKLVDPQGNALAFTHIDLALDVPAQ
jgi:hypothetical protein